jgi:hypothetical protein
MEKDQINKIKDIVKDKALLLREEIDEYIDEIMFNDNYIIDLLNKGEIQEHEIRGFLEIGITELL